VVIELKKDVPGQGILQYLFKTTDLQVAYNFNMIFANHKWSGLLPLLFDGQYTHLAIMAMSSSLDDDYEWQSY